MLESPGLGLLGCEGGWVSALGKFSKLPGVHLEPSRVWGEGRGGVGADGCPAGTATESQQSLREYLQTSLR